MRTMRKAILSSALLGLASRALAQVSTLSPKDTQITFKLNIPASTASSGNGDIFFQLSAPTSYEWVALGQGRGMVGSNIFVVYTSQSGKNVTLSPRLASRYAEPQFNGNAQVTLLEGSGVSNGRMIANVRCSNCNHWSGGDANFDENSGTWVYAYHSSGGPKNSDDTSAGITQHDNQSPFTWDYSKAKGGNSVNPLFNSAPASTGTATASCVPRPTSGTATVSRPPTSTGAGDDHSKTWGGRPTYIPTTHPNDKRQTINYCDDSQSPDSNTDFAPILGGGPLSGINKRLAAHGVLASLAFVIFFPAGAIAVRLGSFRFVVAFHAAFQVFAYLVYIIAFALGVTMAKDLKVLDSHHPIIGIVVLALLFLQPFLGFAHHALFKKHQTRTFISHAHIWVGRIVIVLGIINGGLGFRLAKTMGKESKSGKIAYSVLAGIFGLAWIAAIIVGETKRAKRGTENPPKYVESPVVQQDPVKGHYAPK